MITRQQFLVNIATLCGQLISPDAETRNKAAIEGLKFLSILPKQILNSPHNAEEIKALCELITKVEAVK